ncbi:MAG: exodeoxyribonuclease V alpha subunit, partial [Halothiobacillaceae bacterium]
MTSLEFNNLQPSPSAEELKGVVERLTFHNEENGFSVLRVNVGTREMLATVVGVTAMVRVGDHIECEGTWGNDKTHGIQFRATAIHVVPPSSLEGIERFLNSGLVQGIGPHFAKELLNRFGERVFEVIEREPQRLSEIPGLGKKRRAQLLASWAEQRAVRDIMVYLQSHGIGPARAVRIYKTYGDEAIHKVQENPYRLALDIHGIGFKIADALALSIGMPEQSLMRSSAGVRHVLQEFASQGHCAVEQLTLVQATVKLLAISAEQVQVGIDAEVDAGRLIRERIHEANSYFLAPLQRAEVYVARRLLRLLQGECYGDKIEVLSALEWVMGVTGLLLSPSQQAAIATVLGAKVAVITGGPGVGKTTVVNSILQIVRAAGVRVLLCAPTGRA